MITKSPSAYIQASKYFGLTYVAKVISTVLNELRNNRLVKLSSDISIKFSKETINYLNQISYTEFKDNSENIINSLNKTKDRLDRIRLVELEKHSFL